VPCSVRSSSGPLVVVLPDSSIRRETSSPLARRPDAGKPRKLRTPMLTLAVGSDRTTIGSPTLEFSDTRQTRIRGIVQRSKGSVTCTTSSVPALPRLKTAGLGATLEENIQPRAMPARPLRSEM
jgi:hypothetical protein